MRTFQIGKDGRMVDLGDVPCEYDPQPKPRMHKDFFDILVEAGVEESTRPDPFAPILAPCHACGICGKMTANFAGEFCLQCVPLEEDDPFRPLAPESTTDASQDRVLDAAMRSYCQRKREEQIK